MQQMKIGLGEEPELKPQSRRLKSNANQSQVNNLDTSNIRFIPPQQQIEEIQPSPIQDLTVEPISPPFEAFEPHIDNFSQSPTIRQQNSITSETPTVNQFQQQSNEIQPEPEIKEEIKEHPRQITEQQDQAQEKQDFDKNFQNKFKVGHKFKQPSILDNVEEHNSDNDQDPQQEVEPPLQSSQTKGSGLLRTRKRKAFLEKHAAANN